MPKEQKKEGRLAVKLDKELDIFQKHSVVNKRICDYYRRWRELNPSLVNQSIDLKFRFDAIEVMAGSKYACYNTYLERVK